MLKPEYIKRYEPKYPCRIMEIRHCPAIYKSICGDSPCARFESEDETPWVPEIS
jgi:hypothetical protein